MSNVDQNYCADPSLYQATMRMAALSMQGSGNEQIVHYHAHGLECNSRCKLWPVGSIHPGKDSFRVVKDPDGD